MPMGVPAVGVVEHGKMSVFRVSNEHLGLMREMTHGQDRTNLSEAHIVSLCLVGWGIFSNFHPEIPSVSSCSIATLNKRDSW